MLDEPGVVVCRPPYCAGRRPAGLVAARAAGSRRTTLGELFARMAGLERASVDAFHTLARDLRRHGAPRRLVHAARRARRDEIRHVRITGGLARRHGAAPSVPGVAPCGARSLEAIAIENAREGCVRETFGALVALWQSRKAGDATTRAAMTRIARDETSHAELAWAVHGWAMGKLAPDARRRVRAAMHDEASVLACGLPEEPEAALVRDAGLPMRSEARRLVQAWIEAMGLRDRDPSTLLERCA